MGLFNHNSHVSVERLVRDVNVRPSDQVFEIGSSRYVPSQYDKQGYRVIQAYFLNKGVRGTWSHVRGESAGVVYEREEARDNALDISAIVSVPVKAHDFSTTVDDIPFTAEKVAEVRKEVTPEEFYEQLIARAVLVAANGTGEQQSNQ